MKELATENKDLKREVKSLKETLNEAKEERDQLYADLGTAINQIDDLEQYTRKHNLEIHGIPEKIEENLVAQVITLGNALSVTIGRDDSLRAGSLVVWIGYRGQGRRSRNYEPAKPARRMARGKVSLHASY